MVSQMRNSQWVKKREATTVVARLQGWMWTPLPSLPGRQRLGQGEGGDRVTNGEPQVASAVCSSHPPCSFLTGDK